MTMFCECTPTKYDVPESVEMTKSDDTDRMQVFVSYSHKDLRWLERLKVHLTPLSSEYAVDLWDDTRLRPGSRWRQEIRSAVDKANAAILIISADFLASEFIRNDELPPLLLAAEEEGTLILPIIASPSLFLRKTELSKFQTVNHPSLPLISATEGEQEAIFVRVADALLGVNLQRTRDQVAETTATESFLDRSTWSRLIKIGDWIFDEQRSRIIGSGMRAYLLSREEYGEAPFVIKSRLEFTNFERPVDRRLGMNAGIIFGWKAEKGANRYYNILLTGSELSVERVGFKGGSEGQDYVHLIEPIPYEIESGKPTIFEVRVGIDQIEIDVNDKRVRSLERPTGVVGRVGLRPWRSQMDCTTFNVTSRAGS
jgi:hypothetical protein